MADAIEETDVAVVEAGGGGAVLALALAKQGISTVSGSVDHGGVADDAAI